jgi:putative ABC transport system substrate-binding protein
VPNTLPALQDAARARGVDLVIQNVGTPEEIAPAIDSVKASGAAGLNVVATPLFYAYRRIILERTAALGLPVICQWPEIVQEGSLAAYGPSFVQIYRQQMSRQLARLLRGTRPTDLPVEQPMTFELVINLRTAKTLGLTVPQSLLARADKVIE